MSKTTKRVVLALVLLCLSLGGTALYFRGSGSSEHAKVAAVAGQPSTPIAAAPMLAVTPSPSPPPATAEPVAPPEERASPTVARSRKGEERERASDEPREERRSHRKKAALALEDPEPAARSRSQAPSVVAPGAAPAEPSLPQPKFGNIAIDVRPKLGDAVQSFEIVKVAASVDGRAVAELDGKSFSPHKGEVEAWNGAIEAGAHVLNIVVEYHGNGHGVFSYFDGYRYTARSSTLFRLDEGARLHMLVDLVDKGGVNTAFEKRLAIAFAPRP
jgi:hypothetical protein